MKYTIHRVSGSLRPAVAQKSGAGLLMTATLAPPLAAVALATPWMQSQCAQMDTQPQVLQIGPTPDSPYLAVLHRLGHHNNGFRNQGRQAESSYFPQAGTTQQGRELFLSDGIACWWLVAKQLLDGTPESLVR